jgi:hypothetical protein
VQVGFSENLTLTKVGYLMDISNDLIHFCPTVAEIG